MHDPTKPAFIGLVPVNGTEPTLPLSMWTEGPGPLAGGNSSAPPPHFTDYWAVFAYGQSYPGASVSIDSSSLRQVPLT